MGRDTEILSKVLPATERRLPLVRRAGLCISADSADGRCSIFVSRTSRSGSKIIHPLAVTLGGGKIGI